MALYDYPPDEDLDGVNGNNVSAFKVSALYDFEAQPGTGELSIHCGEVLTVIRTDVGEGWWEGMNQRGESGLFPEAYVEELGSDSDEAPPPMAPPPLPPDYGNNNPVASTDTNGGWSMTNTATTNAANDDDWGNPGGWGLPPVGKTNTQRQQQQEQAQQWTNDNNQAGVHQQIGSTRTTTTAHSYSANTNQAFDDDWDSDFDDQPSSQQMPPPPAPGMLSLPNRNSTLSGSAGDLSSTGKRGGSGAPTGSGRASFNRFSKFVQTGVENFILGKLNVNVQESDIIQVIDSGNGVYSWLNTQPPYNCDIASPKKESKLHGLKTFIAYQLTPSFRTIPVTRRYKHFDWLHERLEQKFAFLPVPPLPDKQIQGRYEQDFIDRRMFQLQSFVDRMCRHPVLSQCDVWNHFMTCVDDKKWKSGKRKAEKDPLIGGSLLMAIKVPDKPMDQQFLESQVTQFTSFTNCMDAAVKNMFKTCADQTQKFQTHFKREYQGVGKAFQQLGAAMQNDGFSEGSGLTSAITYTGESYEDIGKLFDEQPKLDWERFGDVMHDYRGLLGGWPGVLQIHSGAVGKRREFEKMSMEGKVGQSEVIDIGNRTDTLSYALLAEINNFHTQRITDMKIAHQKFLKEQIAFYQKITEKLQDALRMYDSC